MRPPFERPLLIMAISMLLLGCVASPDVEPSACRRPQPATAEIGAGTATSGFQPLADGDDALVTLGSQGLDMIQISVKLTDFEMPGVQQRLTRPWVTVRQRGTLLGSIRASVSPLAISKDTVAFFNMETPITRDAIDTYLDQLVDVDVVARDGCGRLIHAKRVLRLVK